MVKNGLKYIQLKNARNFSTELLSEVMIHVYTCILFDRWHFARDSVLEEKVRRRRRMFSWDHIIHHRTVMKKYRDAYTKKLSNPKKVPQDVQKGIEVKIHDIV